MGDEEQHDASAESGGEDISDTPAPSVGPNTTIHKEPPEERLARHEQSEVDAMGLDKRRQVVGGQYGASFGKQATLYGVALAVLAVIVVAFILLTKELDKAPETVESQAPWSEPQAADTPPSPLE